LRISDYLEDIVNSYGLGRTPEYQELKKDMTNPIHPEYVNQKYNSFSYDFCKCLVKYSYLKHKSLSQFQPTDYRELVINALKHYEILKKQTQIEPSRKKGELLIKFNKNNLNKIKNFIL